MKPVRIRIEGYTVTWEHIGEGHSGDYNPRDPEDERLLRATLTHRQHFDDGESYCTALPVDTTREDLIRASYHLVSQVIAQRGRNVPHHGEVMPRHVMDAWTGAELPTVRVTR